MYLFCPLAICHPPLCPNRETIPKQVNKLWTGGKTVCAFNSGCIGIFAIISLLSRNFVRLPDHADEDGAGDQAEELEQLTGTGHQGNQKEEIPNKVHT